MPTLPHFDLLDSPLEGRNLLEASAGTGKTFTIAALYLRLLLETDLTVDRILVVTFTEAATEELRDRIRARIRAALDGLCGTALEDAFLHDLLGRLTTGDQRRQAASRLREALICFDEAAIYTIHGFCQRILQDQAFEAGALFDTELITNQTHLLDEIAQDFWRTHCADRTGPFAAYLFERKMTPAAFSALLRQMTGDPAIAVVPAIDEQDLSGLEEAWLLRREALRVCWQAQQAEIKDLLVESTALNRKQYNRSSLPGWFADIDSYFASSTAFRPPDKLVEKFTPAALAAATKKQAAPPHHPFFDLCAAAVVDYGRLEAAYADRLIALQTDFIRYLRQALPERKQAHNIRHFDDLLLDVRDRLASTAGPRLGDSIRSQFRAAFIDEFQDTDPVQFAIFRHLYPDRQRPVFFIGDPKQAIYSFRGADIFAYIEATRLVEHRYTLSKNWRSTAALVQAINTIFGAHDRPFVFDEISFQPVDAHSAESGDGLRLAGGPDPHPFQVWTCEPLEAGKPDNVDLARRRLARAVSHEIARLLHLARDGAATIGGRPLEAGQIAVLVRTHKEGRLIEETLKQQGIPSVQNGTGSLFDTHEAQEVMRVLRALADPVNESLVKAALASDLFGLSGHDLGRMQKDEKLLEVWLDRFLEYNRIWQSRGLIVMTGRLLAEQNVRPRLLGLTDGQRRLTNLLHCFEVLHKAAQEQHFGIDGLLQWFARQFEQERGREEYQIRLESDDNAVQIVTIHKSKGLEYPIVFCPFCWNSAREPIKTPLFFHDPAEHNRRTIDLGSAELPLHAALAERERLAEQMRLLYVAVTRAKYRCYVGWGQLKGAESSALGYLLHAPHQPGRDQAQAALVIDYPAGLQPATIAADLARLAGQSQGVIWSGPLPGTGHAVGAGPQPARHLSLRLPDFAGRIERAWCISSFSNLTAGPQQPQEFRAQEKRWTTDESDLAPPHSGQDDFVDFIDFPKGAAAGSCLHRLFEELDFRSDDPALLEQASRSALQAFGFDLRWVPAVMTMVERTLATPIATPDGTSLRLNQVDHGDRLTEMEFMLPLGTIDVGSLAGIFAAHEAGPTGPAGFAGQLRQLGFSRHHGMLQGFIDLVFRHAGRYYLLDWKSNFLGPGPAAYRQPALAAAMQSSYYTLQYHLYLVALHRHLADTLPGYNYAAHFGGVVYAYLRGTALNHEPEAALGIYHDRPDPALIEALGHYLETGKEVA